MLSCPQIRNARRVPGAGLAPPREKWYCRSATIDMVIIPRLKIVSNVIICRRPRRDSLCVWNVRPLNFAFSFADRIRGHFIQKPVALKAGEADSRNRKTNLPLALGPRYGFLISHSSPPAKNVSCLALARGMGRAIGRLLIWDFQKRKFA